jgi:hypothetical protein
MSRPGMSGKDIMYRVSGMSGMSGMAGMPRMAGVPVIPDKKFIQRIAPFVPLERTVPQALARLIPKFGRLFFDKKKHPEFDNTNKYPLQYIQAMPASYKILEEIIKENLKIFVSLLDGIRFNDPNYYIEQRIRFEQQQRAQIPAKNMVNIGDLYGYITPTMVDFVMSLYSPVINRGPNSKCSIRWFNISPKLLILDTDPRLAILNVIPSGNYVENAYRLLDGYLCRVRYNSFTNSLSEYDLENFSTQPGWHDRRRDLRRHLLYAFFNMCPQDIAGLNKVTMLIKGLDNRFVGEQPLSDFLLDITSEQLNNKPLRDMFREDGYDWVIDRFQSLLKAARVIWNGTNPSLLLIDKWRPDTPENRKLIEDIKYIKPDFFKGYEQSGGLRHRKTRKLRS